MKEGRRELISAALAEHERLPLLSEQGRIILEMILAGAKRKDIAARINRHINCIERTLNELPRWYSQRKRNPLYQPKSYTMDRPENLRYRRTLLQVEKKKQAIDRAKERIEKWEKEIAELEKTLA